MKTTVDLVLMLAVGLLIHGRAQAQTNDDLALVADFAARDALPQSPVPMSEWVTMKGWGPKASAYPEVKAPQGRAPITWKRARVLAVAKKYIGLPYRHHHIPAWAPAGEVDPEEAGNGLDCSNFTSWVYNYGLGIRFASDIEKQSDGPGRVLAADEPLAPGDLLFIRNQERTRISHVALYLDPDHVIDCHAAGVAIRAFKGWYKTHLDHVRRILE